MYNELHISVGTHSCGGVASIRSVVGLAVVLLMGTGIAYRIGAARLEAPAVVQPPMFLAEVPICVDGWVGEKLEIPSVTEAYMESNFADDYISRRYVNQEQQVWADAYVVYCASRPAGLLGHQPMVCFPAHGWIHDETSPSEYTTSSGKSVKCLVHRFHRSAPDYRQIVVLSFYVLNGEITLHEGDFSGFFGRRPNIFGNPAQYVAQVQISSVLEHSARSLAVELTDSILAILPDQNGRAHWPISQQDSSCVGGTVQLGE